MTQFLSRKSKAKPWRNDIADISLPSDNLKGNSLTNGITKKVAAIKLESSPAAPEQTKVRSKGLDVLKLWTEERPKRKASAAFVVVGHVDHGKSTLMGRLLLDTGAVAQRDIDKYVSQTRDLHVDRKLTVTDTKSKLLS
jgi:elongation factor 1 alpha-like protein